MPYFVGYLGQAALRDVVGRPPDVMAVCPQRVIRCSVWQRETGTVLTVLTLFPLSTLLQKCSVAIENVVYFSSGEAI